MCEKHERTSSTTVLVGLVQMSARNSCICAFYRDNACVILFQVDLTKFCSLLEHRRGVTATARTLDGKHALTAEMGLRDLSPRRYMHRV